VAKGVGTGSADGPAPGATPAAVAAQDPATRRPGGPKKVKRVAVLVQSEPEGAEIFVAGKLEAVGKTPMWLSLEMDRDNPARVMLRKPGFRDKALAVEVERPPVVQLLPTGGSPGAAGTLPTASAEVPAGEAGRGDKKDPRHKTTGARKER
jgi:hypothetical protein